MRSLPPLLPSCLTPLFTVHSIRFTSEESNFVMVVLFLSLPFSTLRKLFSRICSLPYTHMSQVSELPLLHRFFNCFPEYFSSLNTLFPILSFLIFLAFFLKISFTLLLSLLSSLFVNDLCSYEHKCWLQYIPYHLLFYIF